MRRRLRPIGWGLLALAIALVAVIVTIGALRAHNDTEFNRWVGWATVGAVPLTALGILLAVWEKVIPTAVEKTNAGRVGDDPADGNRAQGDRGEPVLAHIRPAHEWGPVALGVQKAIGGNPLPAFVRRLQDELLDAAVDPAVTTNRLIVLRGEPSTGKSRSAYQAVTEGPLRNWRLYYPSVPAELARFLDEGVPSRTVLWLREIRDYVDAEGGQDAIARLIRLLTGSESIIVIATTWRKSWNAYTDDHRGGPGTRDSYSAARALLVGLPELTNPADVDTCRGGVIDVPDEFTDTDMILAQQLQDPAIIEAIQAAANDGKPAQIVQYLAGVPDLLRHFEGPGADPYVHALIRTAIDVARLIGTPRCTPAFLEQAAPGYLPSDCLARASETWFSTAIVSAATELRGAVRALIPIPPKDSIGVASYQVTDYLEQYGRKRYSETIPPRTFWSAATSSKLVAQFAAAAGSLGLLRVAAQLAKDAAPSDASAASELAEIMHHIDPDDERPSQWVAANTDLTRPGDIARLLQTLRRLGARNSITTVLQRVPAANADLTDSKDIGHLLEALQEVGATDQVAALMARSPIDRVDPSDSLSVYCMIRALRQIGAAAHLAALAERAVNSTDITDPYWCASTLDSLREGEAHGQVVALLDRNPDVHVDLADVSGTAELLTALHEVGADRQVAVLAERAIAVVDPENIDELNTLLQACFDAGATTQVRQLLANLRTEEIDLRDTFTVGAVLDTLVRISADEKVARLLGQDIGMQADLSDPYKVAFLLHSLQEAGAHDHIDAVLARDPIAAADPAEPTDYLDLLNTMGTPSAEAYLAALIERLPASGAFTFFLRYVDHAEDFRFGRERDGRPALKWSWDDL